VTDEASALDWRAWHKDYEADTPLARRLAIVQRHIGAFLTSFEATPVRVISMCAGDGRDLLGALADSGRRDVNGRLVELDPVLAQTARHRARQLGLDRLEVVTGDAGESGAYAVAVPADLVLACGVFGNISDEDVQNTVRALPELCAGGGTVIWTRHRRPPDLTASIRRWLAEAGFEEVAFEGVSDSPASVGVARFAGHPQPLVDRHLFTFNRTSL
jgi:hypothetical protein